MRTARAVNPVMIVCGIFLILTPVFEFPCYFCTFSLFILPKQHHKHNGKTGSYMILVCTITVEVCLRRLAMQEVILRQGLERCRLVRQKGNLSMDRFFCIAAPC